MNNDGTFSAPAPELPQTEEQAEARDQGTVEVSAKPHRGGTIGNKANTTHGLRRLDRRLRGAGIAKADGRSMLERLKKSWKEDIRADCGGELTRAKETLLEVAANTWLMASSADDYILERGPVLRRKGVLRPIVEQRGKLVRTLRELLTSIGLDRAAREVEETLADVVAQHKPRRRGSGTPGSSAPLQP